MSDSFVPCLRNEITRRLDLGGSLAEVQEYLIEPAPGLSEDERAALWLFAWSYRPTVRKPARPPVLGAA